MPPQPVIRRETILFNAIALAMRQLKLLRPQIIRRTPSFISWNVFKIGQFLVMEKCYSFRAVWSDNRSSVSTRNPRKR